MRLLLQFVLAVCCICSVYGLGNVQVSEGLVDDKLERLVLLKKAHDLGLVDEKEFEGRRTKIMDEITGVSYAPQAANVTGNGTIFSPQVKFLLNQLVQGLPRSYQDILPTGENYWTTSIYLDVGAVDPKMNSVPLDSIIAVQERTLTRYGLNLYDGATWEIALALEGLYDIAALYEKNTLYTSGTGADVAVGGIINIRADDDTYEYGVNAILGSSLRPITLPGNSSRVIAHNGAPTSEISKKQAGAFFYRMIGPKYRMNDPLTGDYAASFKYPYPNDDTTTPWNIGGVVHWNDWKPITGENVWGAIMGPIQALWVGNKSVITPFMTFDDAPGPIQLAISVLPALKALQSPLGSLYHCPKGTKMFPPDSDEKSNVSNENNFSGYASLKMLQEVLTAKTKGTNDVVLMQALMDVNSLVSGLESWFSKYLFSTPYKNYRVIFQGGHVTFDGQFNAVQIGDDGGFAVDCQTWGLTVLGQKRVDSWYGNGTAYQVWQAVKEFSGYFDPSGKLGGVGYTIVTGTKHNLVWSAEWTWGAISMCEKLAYEYKLAGKSDWAQSLLDDAASMVKLIQTPMVRCKNSGWCGGGLMQEDGSYLYANSRFFIPWGWYANPIGATCSTAWSVMYAHKFNPFVLGGGEVSPLAL